MAEIVNLRRARKQRERSAKAEHAAQNRLIHGLSHAETAAQTLKKLKDNRHIDGHLRQIQTITATGNHEE